MIDLILYSALPALLTVWALRRAPHRRAALLVLCCVLATTAAAGVALGRWQAAPAGAAAAIIGVAVLLRRHPRSGARPFPWLSAGLLAPALTACAMPLYLLPVVSLPKPTGPYAVGRVVADLTDTDGNAGAATAPRRLQIVIWYPAAQQGPRSAYASRAEAASVFVGLARSMGLPGFLFSHVPLISANATPNAVPLDVEEPSFPVVLFSHGMGSYPAQNSALMEALASHGYIAISMAHAGDTPAIVFEDGQTEIYPPLPPSDDDLSTARSARFLGASYDERLEGLLVSERIARGGGDPLADRAAIWLQDRLFLSRTLREGGMPAAARVVLGAADVNRIVHAGMSFGGSMSVSACGLDPACEAAINLDGGDYHFTYLDASTPRPLLMLHADWTVGPLPPGITRHPPPDMAFNDFSYEPFDTAGADRNVYRMRVRGVTHTGLSDFGLMLRQPLRGPLAGDIPGDMLAAVLNDTVIGFLDAHVKRVTNGFPEAVYTKHAALLAPHDASGVRLWWSRKSEMERDVLRTAVRSLSPPPPTVAGMMTETE